MTRANCDMEITYCMFYLTENLCENFKNYPPWVLPTDGYQLHLKSDHTDEYFRKIHNQILLEFGVPDGKLAT